MDNTNRFNNMIDKRVLEHIAKKRYDFGYIVGKLKGIHPIQIYDSIKRLNRYKRIPDNVFKKIKTRMKDKSQSIKEDNNYCFLPVPHMLDFDWRFSQDSIKYIYNMIRPTLSIGHKTVIFLGTPSLFHYAVKQQLSNKRNYYVLIDQNCNDYKDKMQIDNPNIRFINTNILEDAPPFIKADIVIMDPPWYLEHTKKFIEYAKNMCRVNGKILIAMYPIETRPGVEEEYEALMEYCKDCGFEKEKNLVNALRYITPPFEINALKANEIYRFPAEWRTGNLLVIKKLTRGTEMNIISVDQEFNWIEEMFDDIVRIKVKDNKQNSIGPLLERLYAENDDVYPSVSKRDAFRKGADVWTSGNRVFRSSDTKLLLDIMRSIKYDYDIIDTIQKRDGKIIDIKKRKEIISVIETIKAVINKEKKEYGKWGKNRLYLPNIKETIDELSSS